MQTRYNQAIAKLELAEGMARAAEDWDTLARLYMPLQEARRQRRQRCSEGVVRMDFVANGPGEKIHSRTVFAEVPHGQVLVAGWASVAPAAELRRLAERKGLYLDVFLAAAFPTDDGLRIGVIPRETDPLPDATIRPPGELQRLLPEGSLLLSPSQLSAKPSGGFQDRLDPMGLWERLHAPFLAKADGTADPVARIDAYRGVIEIDPGCELAHQKLSATAKRLIQDRRRAESGPH